MPKLKNVIVRLKEMYATCNNTNKQMNGQFANQFNISLMSLKHLLRFAKQLTIRFINLIIIFKLIHWPFKFKGY